MVEKLATFDLPGVQAFKPSTSKKFIGQDIQGFDDFSTRSPEKLLTRSGRASGSTSTPPLKRRKNSPSKIAMATSKQSEQLLVPPNQQFLNLDGPIIAPIHNFDHPHSSNLPKSHPTNLDDKNVPRYIKKYVNIFLPFILDSFLLTTDHY